MSRLVTRLFALAAAMTLGAIAAVPVLNPTAAWRFGQNEGTLSSPSLRNNTVFVGTASGAVHALDRNFGTVLWTAQVIDAVNGSIGFDEIDVTDPTIYVPTIAGWVYALDGRTGALVWKRMTEMSGVFVRPAVYNKSVYVDVADGGIWFLNSTGGVVTTTGGINPHVQRTADGSVSVFAGSADGEVWRSNLLLTNTECMLAPNPADLPIYRPVVMGPLMILNDDSGNVYGIDYTECVKRWNRTIPLGPRPNVQGYVTPIDELNIVVVAAANGVVAALEAYNGSIRWITTVNGSEFSTMPVYGDGFVFVLDLSGTIVVLSAADGTVQQGVDGGAATAPWSRMAYRRGVLVASFSSTVAAYTLAARPSPPATRVPTEAPGTASPVASFVTMTHCSAFNCASGCEHVKYPLNSCVALSNSSSVLRTCARSEMRVQSFDGSDSCAAETPSSIKFFQVGQCINDADAGGSFIVDSC